MCGGIREKGDRKMEELKVFNHKEFGELEILIIDGKEYFPATDVASKLGYAKPHNAIDRHCRKDGSLFRGVTDSLGRKQKKKFIDEGNLYRLIVGSELPEAEKFESWVFDEVLPSIRKHGAYMTPETIEEVLLSPDTLIKLATNLKEEQEKRKQAERVIEEQKPKVLFADAVETSKTSVLVGELAKIIKQNGYNIGQNRLFKWLRDKGYLMKRGNSRNLPTQKSMELGLFEVKKRTINNPDGSIRTTSTPMVTGKGQVYFVEKFLGERVVS